MECKGNLYLYIYEKKSSTSAAYENEIWIFLNWNNFYILLRIVAGRLSEI